MQERPGTWVYDPYGSSSDLVRKMVGEASAKSLSTGGAGLSGTLPYAGPATRAPPRVGTQGRPAGGIQLPRPRGNVTAGGPGGTATAAVLADSKYKSQAVFASLRDLQGAYDAVRTHLGKGFCTFHNWDGKCSRAPHPSGGCKGAGGVQFMHMCVRCGNSHTLLGKGQCAGLNGQVRR